jgi:hypothetical protein
MRFFSRRERPGRSPLVPEIVFVDRPVDPQVADRQRRQRMDDLSRRLRRVRTDVATCLDQEFLPGKRTRVRAGRLAYIDLLVEACELLGVEHELDVLRGVERQFEVLRVEGALDAAGMNLRVAC